MNKLWDYKAYVNHLSHENRLVRRWAFKALEKAFPGKDVVKEIKYKDNVSIIAVVGAGMRGTKGVAARIFSSVAKAGVNILMIAQGSSEVNISFVVLRKDARKAANALHKEFIK